MKHEQWDDIELIETFPDDPAWTAETMVEGSERPGGARSIGGRPGPPLRRVAAAALGAVVLFGGLAGYGWGRSSTPLVIPRLVSVSPASEAVPSVDVLGADDDTGPCDRLAVTDSRILATDPVPATISHYFPQLLISSAATSRYDANDEVCAVDITAVDQQLVLTLSLRYFGIQDDLISTSSGTQGGQASLAFTRDFGEGQYSVSAEFTNPSDAGLPALPLVQAFVSDPAMARPS